MVDKRSTLCVAKEVKKKSGERLVERRKVKRNDLGKHVMFEKFHGYFSLRNVKSLLLREGVPTE